MNTTLSNKAKIVQYLYENKHASKVEIVNTLGISLPTVLQNSKELIKDQIIIEAGAYESTGGRKAKSLQINGRKKVSLGIDITANHIVIVLVDLTGECIVHNRKRRIFSNSLDYYTVLKEELEGFIQSNSVDKKSILGVGISFPGIINHDTKTLLKSHALLLENVSLSLLQQIIPYPVYFENDANAAIMAESSTTSKNVIYLSLSNTVGGAICINGQILRGNNNKAGEFGHMTLVPDGQICYCGKNGCVDAYCSSLVLSKNFDGNLELFMQRLEQKNPQALLDWDNYLQYLAITVTNLRMAYDVDIILGGYIGHYLSPYLLSLGKKIMEYNTFESDISYIKTTMYGKEASAIGVAKYFIKEYIQNLS